MKAGYELFYKRWLSIYLMAGGKETDGTPSEESINTALGMLSDRERAFLEIRFGLGLHNQAVGETLPRTLRDVGLRFHVSRSRAGQIVDKSFRKLLHPSRRVLMWRSKLEDARMSP